jgi:hypothetical protein
VPAALLLRSPGLPRGQRVLGYRADGTCPLLEAGNCTIYPDRPQTCRDYDCRVFAAAGIAAGGDEKGEINGRVRAWRFRYVDDADAQAHAAVRAAAEFIREAHASFPPERAPTAPTGIAVLALKVYELFLDGEAADATTRAQQVVAHWQAFDRESA